MIKWWGMWTDTFDRFIDKYKTNHESELLLINSQWLEKVDLENNDDNDKVSLFQTITKAPGLTAWAFQDRSATRIRSVEIITLSWQERLILSRSRFSTYLVIMFYTLLIHPKSPILGKIQHSLSQYRCNSLLGPSLNYWMNVNSVVHKIWTTNDRKIRQLGDMREICNRQNRCAPIDCLMRQYPGLRKISVQLVKRYCDFLCRALWKEQQSIEISPRVSLSEAPEPFKIEGHLLDYWMFSFG
jgi:hypothetical protein